MYLYRNHIMTFHLCHLFSKFPPQFIHFFYLGNSSRCHQVHLVAVPTRQLLNEPRGVKCKSLQKKKQHKETVRLMSRIRNNNVSFSSHSSLYKVVPQSTGQIGGKLSATALFSLHFNKLYIHTHSCINNTSTVKVIMSLKILNLTPIYQGCIYVCREGGHVSERVVPGGWSVQQVTPQLFMLCYGWSLPFPTLTHTSHTYLTPGTFSDNTSFNP